MSIADFASESLQQGLDLAGYTAKLVEAWGSVGESSETQQGYVTDLANNLRALLDHALDTAEQRKIDLQAMVNRKRTNVEALKTELAGAISEEENNNFSLPAPEHSLIAQLESLEATEAHLSAERQRWLSLIAGKQSRANVMCEALGLDMDKNFVEIGPLTQARVDAFDAHIEFLGQTQEERRLLIVDFRSSIKQYWGILETVPTTPMEKSIADETCDLGVHKEIIEALQQVKADLNVEYQNREAETAELGEEIQHLWDLLQIDETFQQYFSQKNGGIGLSAVEACRDERQRLLIKKENLMPRIIEHERQQIIKLFEETSCDLESQQKQFPAFHTPPKDPNSEEHLATLKTYTVRLQTRLEALKPILGRIERREALVQERAEYKAIISDPNRLTSRKGGLSHLKENEMRIRVEKKLPKLEGIIENLVTEWEKENDAVLTINGVRFLENMKEQQLVHAAEQEKAKTSRTEALKTKKASESNLNNTWKRTKRPTRGRKKATAGAENSGTVVN